MIFFFKKTRHAGDGDAYLCIIELCLHIQRLQNLVENGLQTEQCGFLTLWVHSADKVS